MTPEQLKTKQIESLSEEVQVTYFLTFSTRFLSVSWMLVSGTGFSE